MNFFKSIVGDLWSEVRVIMVYTYIQKSTSHWQYVKRLKAIECRSFILIKTIEKKKLQNIGNFEKQ